MSADETRLITRKKTPTSVIGSVYRNVSEPMILAVCISSSTAIAESSGVSLNSATR
jgi:hypothetical protein